MAKTVARTFRLGDETIDLLDRIGHRLGGMNRTAVLRLAVSRLADAELRNEKKSGKKEQKSE